MDDAGLLAAARALAPVVAAHADDSDTARRLAPAVFEAIRDADLWRMVLPPEIGGSAATAATTVRVLEEISAVDAATGWCLMIGAENSGFAACWLPEASARAIFAGHPEAVTVGSASGLGTAVSEDGGYRVSGRWGFGSGSTHAGWFFGVAAIRDGDTPRLHADGQPVTREFVVPAAQVTVHDTWDTLGMRGTASNHFSVDAVHVPEAYTFDWAGPSARRTAPLFNLPLMSVFALTKVGVATGTARGALDAFRALATEKTAFGARATLADQQRIHLLMAEAESRLEAGRAWVFHNIALLEELVGDGREPTIDQRARFRLACNHAIDESVAVVDLVFKAAGTSGGVRGHPLERRFRDIHVASQHFIAGPIVAAAAGEVLLGRRPEGVLL